MTNKTWNFKLDGEIHSVSIEHSPDMKYRDIRLDGMPVAGRRSKINSNDYTFDIGGHFCIAQIRLVGEGEGFTFTYDLLIDGRSLEARRQKREAVATGSKQPAAAQGGFAEAKSRVLAQASAHITDQVSTRRPAPKAGTSLLKTMMAEEETAVSKQRLMSPTQAEKARKQLSAAAAKSPRYESDEDEEDVRFELPASFTRHAPKTEETIPYWMADKLYEPAESDVERPQSQTTSKARSNKKTRRPRSTPAWAWLFMLTCGLIPVASLGGAIPGAIGFGGAAMCRSIARGNASVALRVMLCVIVAAACWGAMIALVGGLTLLTKLA